ncbi:MAG: lipid-A-disaccharide synthase [Coleofasciculaceae cyanobacterium SM2_1_6]|nr:lipid-A-disaccharide synthase [Coleofasciculaceae cyanobacterium SM2_1_6]
MQIFISTGEVSGDLQGGMLVEALYRQGQVLGIDLEITALGGERMKAAGAKLLGDTTAIGSMGLIEALRFVLPTLKVQSQAKAYLKKNRPDLIVLIDYWGPNSVIGNYIHKHLPDVPVVYYIAPQLWVWCPFPEDLKRAIRISDRILAIFPEEAKYFQSHGADVTWVGHPLVDRVDQFPSRAAARAELGISPTETAIALFPASRHQELKYLMPVMFQAAKVLQARHPHVSFWIPLALPAYADRIEQAIGDYGIKATLVRDNPTSASLSDHTAASSGNHSKQKAVIAAADLAITKSGTVNLELALLNIPQVVIYRVNKFTYWIAKDVLRFPRPLISPVNLVVMREIVPELLQAKVTVENMVQAAEEFLLNPQRLAQMQQDYQEVREKLGSPGVGDRAAKEILQLLKTGKSDKEKE